MKVALPPGGRYTGVVLAVVIAAAQAQERSPWTLGLRVVPGQGAFSTASTFAETRASDTTSYALSLVCGSDRRQASVSSGHVLPWQPSPRDARDSYVSVQVSIDDGRAQAAVLLRETDGTGQLTSPLRVMRREIESPGLDAVLQRQVYGLGGSGLPARRVTITGLAAEPIEFRFDTLTTVDRERLRKMCFGIDEHQLAQAACKKEARARAQQAYESRVHDVNRAWCDNTRDARRQQLIDRFLRGVAAARNGGPRLAAAFAEFIAHNPDIVMPEQGGGTQSCPDPYFLIDAKRLRQVLERTAAPDVAGRHLEELLKESGVVVSSVGTKFDPPQPAIDRRSWAAGIEVAEAQCNADKVEPQRD